MAKLPDIKPNQPLGIADMSAKPNPPTPMTNAMQMRPMPVEKNISTTQKHGGYIKKYAKGGAPRKVRY